MISILVASILLISVIVKWKSYSFLGKDFFKFGLKRSFSGLHDKILKLILVYTGTTTILEMYYGHYSIISDKIIEFSLSWAQKALLILLPSSERIGIFCKFGLEEDNLPVEVNA